MNLSTSETNNDVASDNVSRNPMSESVDDPTLVFQCENCRSILGDSTAWVCSDETLKTITLQQVTDKVKVLDKLKSSPNCGSAFVPLYCRGCNEGIGMMYKTTARNRDAMRDRYSLFVSKMSSYEVGSCRSVQIPDDDSKLPLLAKLQADILKVQTVIVSMNARISAIEQYIGDGQE
ncbi:protein Mis18-alpha-like [Haliotis rufescens]|uniref:protein Mis18-alpha-like n=1 Tax=Haliotis rufescens TaxID=6454 RepID=UPI00201F2D2B|nr:protein Mis18-alpha-like [Haliotis rufescens]